MQLIICPILVKTAFGHIKNKAFMWIYLKFPEQNFCSKNLFFST